MPAPQFVPLLLFFAGLVFALRNESPVAWRPRADVEAIYWSCRESGCGIIAAAVAARRCCREAGTLVTTSARPWRSTMASSILGRGCSPDSPRPREQLCRRMGSCWPCGQQKLPRGGAHPVVRQSAAPRSSDNSNMMRFSVATLTKS